jgi:DNA (cytosine-5)-methyltransferase 1
MGYHRAGFDVVGVDINPQPNYPFEFIQADALEYMRSWLSDRPTRVGWHVEADAIHASPPCQGYTSMNNRHGSGSPLLIAQTRELLQATGLPYVIENVVGARDHMIDPVLIHGAQVGLSYLARPRLFETNWHLMAPFAARNHDAIPVYGKLDGRRLWTRKDGTELRAPKTLEIPSKAMGIDWMTWDELREAIPPAYTELIGHQLHAHVLSPNRRYLSSDAQEHAQKHVQELSS